MFDCLSSSIGALKTQLCNHGRVCLFVRLFPTSIFAYEISRWTQGCGLPLRLCALTGCSPPPPRPEPVRPEAVTGTEEHPGRPGPGLDWGQGWAVTLPLCVQCLSRTSLPQAAGKGEWWRRDMSFSPSNAMACRRFFSLVPLPLSSAVFIWEIPAFGGCEQPHA